jgi:hypothetical protein
MSISTDYSSPVLVNGYSCRNCEEVANAKKGIDPAEPAAGPYGRDEARGVKNDSAVTFDGLLEALNASSASDDTQSATQDRAKGCIVNVRA